MSSLSDKISKEFFIAILYSAILGNYITGPFAPVFDSIQAWQLKGFLAGAPLDVFTKAMLIVGTSIFFCCELIYGLCNPGHRLYYIAIDFVNLILAGLIFDSIEYKTIDQPNFITISSCF